MTPKARAARAAKDASIEIVAAMLIEFAGEVERDTGRAYAPAYMREAAARLLALAVVCERQITIAAEIDRRQQ